MAPACRPQVHSYEVDPDSKIGWVTATNKRLALIFGYWSPPPECSELLRPLCHSPAMLLVAFVLHAWTIVGLACLA
eukprot:SAG11_NODE_2646_length_3132_cov_4.768216_3_plen_76_part_00